MNLNKPAITEAKMKQPEEISEYLKNQFEDGHIEMETGDIGEPRIRITAEVIKDVAKFLRDDEELRFDVLMCLSGLHYPKEEELGVAYHLYSMKFGHKLALKVRVPIEKPDVPSVESIWKTADWHEREAWDMVGVNFIGHPSLKRILCPDDWEGHPLRKDYVQQEFYRNLTTLN
jgi:NADH-quinone oxidoreductase subunit C